MNQSRLWTLVAVLLIFVLLAGTWFLGVSPRLTDAHQANQGRETAVNLNNMHRATLEQLKADHERLDEFVADLQLRQIVIPELPETSRLYGELHTAARSASLTVTSVNLGQPIAYIPPVLASENEATAGQLAQSGLYVVPVALTAEGSETAALEFASKLQLMPRYLLVHAVTVAKGDGTYTVTIQAQMFGLSADTIPAPEPTPPTAPAE